MARMNRMFRVLLVSLLPVLVGPLALGAESRVAPLISVRADHMVLDAALRGEEVLVATQSGRIESLDWRTGRGLVALFALDKTQSQEFTTALSSLAVSPSGRLCSVVSSDGVVRVLRFDEVGELEPILSLEREAARIVRFLGNDQLLLANLRGELSLVRLADEREIYRHQLEYDPIYALAVGPEGKRVAVGFRSSRIQIVDARAGERLRTLKGHRDSVFDIVWLDDHRLASASKDKSLLLWDLSESEPEPRVLYSADHYVTAVAFEPGSESIAFTVDEQGIGIMDLESGQIIRRLDLHTAPVQVLQFLDDGKRLLSTGNDARVLVWNVARTDGSGTGPRVE